MQYTILEREDISFGRVRRLLFRIRVAGKADVAELRRIAEEVVADEIGRAKVNAIGFLFYLPGTGPKGINTAGMVDWAPDGRWQDADTVEAGDYTRHQYEVRK